MALAYVPPGVFVREEVSPSVNPLLASPANVCVVGLSQGYVQRTDQIGLSGTVQETFPGLPSDAILVNPVLTVRNAASPLPDPAYIEGTDYTISYTNSPINEVQTVALTGSPGGGSFTLGYDGDTTDNIAFNASASTVEQKLEVLTAFDPVDVSVSGSSPNWTVSFAGKYAGADVDLLLANGAGLTGGTSPAVTVTQQTQGRTGAAITRIDSGNIPEGATVNVIYQYIPALYFTATRLDELSSVENLYGSAFNSDGTVNSEVSFAASCAFENGASEVIVQPLFKRTDSSDPNSVPLQPTAADVTNSTTWEQTLYALRDINDINIIVPAIGQSFPGDVLSDAEELTIIQKVQDHIKYMKDQQQYIIGIFGEDSSTSSTVATKTTLRAHIETLQSRFGGSVNEQLIFVSPSKFTRVNPKTSGNFYVGGQYVAAGVAGLLAGQPVSQSITRKVISGFTEVSDPRSKADKNVDAQDGLLVLEQKGPVVQVRHGITTDNTATARREIPVVRAKHRMIESIRDTLESSIIGQVIADGQAPNVVGAAVGAVLEQLKTDKDIVDYNNVQSRTLSLDPTTVEVRYSYKPAFPLNYVNVIFSIDLTSGDLTTVSA
jgi:hypothetical protein